MDRKVMCLLAGASTLALSVGNSVWAADSSDKGDQLEEIVVSATKRNERLQDVPVAVSAFTADQLETANFRDADSLPSIAPGITISYGSQPGNFSIQMRGVGTFAQSIAAEADVVVVIDDIPVGQQAMAFKDMVDLQRVEVLRGSQSTLFGKAAIAGVVNVTTAPPTDHFSGKATSLVTSDGEYRVGATVAGPVTDDIKMRVMLNESNFPGTVHNITNNTYLDGAESQSGSVKAFWDPSQDWHVEVGFNGNKTDSTCCVSPWYSTVPGGYYLAQNVPQLAQSYILRGINVGPHNTDVRYDTRSGGISESWTVRTKISWDITQGWLAGANLSNIASHSHWKMHDYQDVDGTDVPINLYYPVAKPASTLGFAGGTTLFGHFDTDSATEELRLTSPASGPFRYVAGLWYARNDNDRFLLRGPYVNPADYLARAWNANYAVFGQGTYDLFDGTSLVAGLRENNQSLGYRWRNYLGTPQASPYLLGLSTLNAGYDPASNKNDSMGSLTYKAGVEQHIDPDIMAYATYSTGYKGAAYDIVSSLSVKEANTFPVRPERASNYEAGIKNTLFDHHLIFDVDYFYSIFRGFQQTATDVLPDGTFLTYLNSLGRIDSKGVEVDAQARLSREFSLYLRGARVRATIADFPNGACYYTQTAAQGCLVNPLFGTGAVQNLAGKTLPNAPTWKINAGGQYDLPLDGWSFGGFFGADYRWQSDTQFSLNQDPYTIQKAYGIANLRAGIADNDGVYKITVMVNNLLDKRYATGLGDGGNFGITGQSPHDLSWTPARDWTRYYGISGVVNF